jgi:membrane protease YdiL (CAAX protease family)
MSDKKSASSSSNQLLAYSLKHPVLVALILFILACLFKYFDSFVFRLDERIGEAIMTKSLGFLLVVVYLLACGRNLRDIGFHTRKLGKTLLLAVAGFGLFYAFAFTAQLLILRSSGEDAGFALSAVDPRTGMTGGLLFGIWLLFANLVNSAMEEGFFRGVMLRHFLRRFSVWGAILLAAVFFAVWHLSWPLRHLLDGQVALNEVAFEAAALLTSTLISGTVYGYMYYRTDNLWWPFVGHTINNGIFNVLFIRTSSGMQSGLEFAPFTAIFLLGHILLIPIVGWVAKHREVSPVKPWGKFGSD